MKTQPRQRISNKYNTCTVVTSPVFIGSKAIQSKHWSDYVDVQRADSDDWSPFSCVLWLLPFLGIYHIQPNYHTYPYKHTIKKFHSLQITASVHFIYFYMKANIVGTLLNCINLLMQFKWVTTTFAFIKKILIFRLQPVYFCLLLYESIRCVPIWIALTCRCNSNECSQHRHL